MCMPSICGRPGLAPAPRADMGFPTWCRRAACSCPNSSAARITGSRVPGLRLSTAPTWSRRRRSTPRRRSRRLIFGHLAGRCRRSPPFRTALTIRRRHQARCRRTSPLRSPAGRSFCRLAGSTGRRGLDRLIAALPQVASARIVIAGDDDEGHSRFLAVRSQTARRVAARDHACAAHRRRRQGSAVRCGGVVFHDIAVGEFRARRLRGDAPWIAGAGDAGCRHVGDRARRRCRPRGGAIA